MEIEKNLLPRIGTQFFINEDESIEDMEKHFQIMKDYGIKLVRLFILWAHVEPKPGVWVFEKYDQAYALASKYDLKIVSTLTAEDPPSWSQINPFYHHRSNLNDPALKAFAKIYIQQLVVRYKDHPAHYAWLLMNEPELKTNYDAHTLKQFADWLQKKYGTLEHLNSKWYKQYDSFEDITINPEEWATFWTCFASFIDWHEFITVNLYEHLCWIREEIVQYDPVSPTHINPKDLLGKQVSGGQDIWKEGQVVDILGASIHPAWNFLMFERQEYGVAFGYSIDLIRSASGGKSFWVTELQSGSTLMTGLQPFTPTPEEMTAWVWDAIGAGAKAVVYWMWHPRTFGQEGGEWGIVSNNHKVSKRLLASAKISKQLDEHSDFFSQAVPEMPKVAILFNQATEILSMIEGAPSGRKPGAPTEAVAAVYKALTSANIPLDFVNTDQLKSGHLSQYKALFLPYAYALDREVQEKIQAFVADGGRLWADAPCSWKDASGAIYKNSPDLLSEVFGLNVNEYSAASDALTFETTGKQLPTFRFSADIEVTQGTTTSLFKDGTPAIVHNQFGKGETCFIGTAISLGYFHTKNAEYGNLIASFAQDLSSSFVKITSIHHDLIQRVLVTECEFVLILQNWGAPCEVTVQLLSNDYNSAYDITYSRNVPMDDACSSVCLQIKSKETLVIKFSKTAQQAPQYS